MRDPLLDIDFPIAGTNGHPSSTEVGEELRSRGHTFKKFHYTPGPVPSTVKELADQIEGAITEIRNGGGIEVDLDI